MIGNITKKRLVPSALWVFMISMILLTLLVRELYQDAHDEVEQVFEQATQERIATLEKEITQINTTANTIAAHMVSSGTHSETDFLGYFREAGIVENGVTAVSLLIQVPAADEDRIINFLNEINPQWDEKIYLREFRPEVGFLPAGEREVYYPMVYSTSEGIKNYRGIDMGIYSSIVSIQNSENNLKPFAAAFRREITTADPRNGFAITSAIYSRGDDGKKIKRSGIVIISYALEDYINYVLTPFPKGEIAIWIDDAQVEALTPSNIVHFEHGVAAENGLTKTVKIPVYGRDWSITLSATQGKFLPDFTLAIVVSVIGLIAAITLSLSLHYLTTRKDRLEMLVQGRTADLETMKDVAERANASKSKFVANVSHELRTPLTAIHGMLDMLGSADSDGKRAKMLSAAKGATSNLEHLVNDLLDLSQLENAKIKLMPKTFSTTALCNEVKMLAEGQASEKGLKLGVSCAQDNFDSLVGDMPRIRQICLNLVVNAIKFTNEGSVDIIFTTNHIEEEDLVSLHFAVTDTGVGISKEEQDRIFGRFEQVQSDVETRNDGVGLGLSISKELVALMDGTIACTSTEGEGTRFDVHLPLWEAPVAFVVRPEPEPAEPEPEPEPSIDMLTPEPIKEVILDSDQDQKNESLHLLVAEDNDINMIYITHLLEHLGHTLTPVVNGQEAVDALESGDKFDGVLMDMQMPVLNGVEATKLLRKNHKLEYLPIIAITANMLDSLSDDVKQAGFTDFIAKPIDTDAFEATLNAIKTAKLAALAN